MRLQVSFIMQKNYDVEIEISDPEIIEAFEEQGIIECDDDFKDEFDKRWKAEQLAFDKYIHGGADEGEEFIVDRNIHIIE